MQKLHISRRSLATLRVNGTLPFTRIKNKLFYRKSDVLKILSNNFIMFNIRLITDKASSPEDKDLLLLGSLTVISSCLPGIFGIYDERIVYPNLFLFVSAQASAGKGRLSLCRKLVEPVHHALRERNKIENDEFRRKQSDYLSEKGKSDRERPNEPPLRALFIPANSSATALFQILNDNDGIGLMFETEGDTLAQTFKSEHGNYSDGFRKAFHHEKISYLRRKDREYVELDSPRLSALLSGTPKQVASLIPGAENGLFSRFIFYYMDIIPVWKNVFAGNPDQTSLDMVKTLLRHAAKVFDSLLPDPLETPKLLNQKQQFLDAMPADFSRHDYIAVANQLDIPEKTAEKYIVKFIQNGLINRFARDKYRKC